MNTVIMTSPNLSGEISFNFNEEGFLDSLQFTDSLSVKQYKWLFNNIPFHTEQLPGFKTLIPHAAFVQKKMEVTFEMFWNRYNDKVRSSKKKTEKKWNSMTEANQVKAYLFIKKYFQTMGSAEKKYATTYLEAELWNN